MTARERIVEALEQNPEGLSRRALHKAVDCNIGTLRQQISALRVEGTIEVVRELHPAYGSVTVHRLARVASA